MSKHIDPDERELREGIDKAHNQFCTLLSDYCLKHPGVVFHFQVTMTKPADDGVEERVMFNQSIDEGWRPGDD